MPYEDRIEELALAVSRGEITENEARKLMIDSITDAARIESALAKPPTPPVAPDLATTVGLAQARLARRFGGKVEQQSLAGLTTEEIQKLAQDEADARAASAAAEVANLDQHTPSNVIAEAAAIKQAAADREMLAQAVKTKYGLPDAYSTEEALETYETIQRNAAADAEANSWEANAEAAGLNETEGSE